MTDLREVAAFLLGEGELDGVGFGDPHPTERGNYWWRKHLRAALAQPEPEELGEIVPANEEQLKRIAKLVEPEPVAWYYAGSDVEPNSVALDADLDAAQKANCIPLYTVPPKIFCGCGDQIMPDDGAECGTCVTARNAVKHEWVGLTDEELREFEIWLDDEEEKHGWNPPADIVKYIEAKLKEKNA